MIKLILFVLCSSLAPIHTTKCYIRNMYYHLIGEASKPLPQQGKYRIDWAAGVYPENRAVCLEKVMIYYMCYNKTLCNGKSEAKFPSRDKDVSPFILPICADNPNNYPEYFRHTAIYGEEAFRSGVKK